VVVDPAPLKVTVIKVPVSAAELAEAAKLSATITGATRTVPASEPEDSASDDDEMARLTLSHADEHDDSNGEYSKLTTINALY
jgi:hypothetical protein